jgi:hypothetical protein
VTSHFAAASQINSLEHLIFNCAQMAARIEFAGRVWAAIFMGIREIDNDGILF